jgi:hypothetical protein
VRTRKVLRTTLLVTTLKLPCPTSGAIVRRELEGIKTVQVRHMMLSARYRQNLKYLRAGKSFDLNFDAVLAKE